MTFKEFNFNDDLFEGIESMGFTTPTPIQAMAIPIILNGQDIIACAQTGTGKTGAYLLPVLDQIGKTNKHHTSTLILAPTRELAQQIDQQVEGLAYFTGISSIAVFGGGDGSAYEQQRRGIQNNVNIIIATPGRLIAHLTSGVLKLNHLTHLILDEADRMLDMGFSDDIMKIISYLPKQRQTLLFSATMPGRIRTLAKTVLNNPEQINIALSQPAVGIDQQIYRVHDQQKTPLLQMILKNGSYASVIIFCSRKEIVKSLTKELKQAHFKVSAFHSDLEQKEREEILLNFKNKQLPVIIGTDALSRGIDVEGIDLVINYDVPGDPEDYIHRIGRTARAETTGTAITFVNHRDERKLKSIEQLIDKPIRLIDVPDELRSIEQVKQEHSPNRRPPQKRWGNKGQARK
ncbi:DEAD/DEAH box helicase [Mucilaginibacter sp. BJC16-A38]|uniref:DEAD/DEAH box helicase n=1 Tax=Mucilaginibacter phenanthrenivorans TaxID=1234842 RepID=UPI0021583CD3|nr:DEAD/DEAH box helicase [Mucilaginibacter phenanthrenivorans]MCR8559186.1 DEAD/DEAH box helicase [Mucilaginibacter phenanthrenivorans]MDP9079790.1 DEAD/DEAH box helicase [Bacteroidota bacterium]